MGSSVEKLVYMANQIATAFRYQGEREAAVSTCAHIRLFWDSRMRQLIIAYMTAGGEGLSPIAREAVIALAKE